VHGIHDDTTSLPVEDILVQPMTLEMPCLEELESSE
jgi:hypothetical protein